MTPGLGILQVRPSINELHLSVYAFITIEILT